MNPKKQKEKDRRRARKLADQAWEAVDAGNLDLAEKIVRRAVLAQPENPALWTDQGQVLALRNKQVEAAECFRTALSLAPGFAEPYTCLAAIQARQGFIREAITLQAQAVKHDRHNSVHAERLEAYLAMAGQASSQSSEPQSVQDRTPVESSESTNAWASAISPEQLAKVDWQMLGGRLTRDGCVLVPRLLDSVVCHALRTLYDDDALFAKTVVMNRPEFGCGAYRYFRAPIPALVDQLRRSVYPHVAAIANRWRGLLGEPGLFPENWEDFREVCRQAGQTTPTPILLKYGPGGFNALHRDLRGPVFFPIQLAVVLSPRGAESDADKDGFEGGDFLLHDVPEGKKSRRRRLAAGLGDAVLFCTRDRLVSVGGAYGLQPVKHGVSMITAGERYVLGVPFHEYR